MKIIDKMNQIFLSKVIDKVNIERITITLETSVVFIISTNLLVIHSLLTELRNFLSAQFQDTNKN